ncbi:MAG: molybdopterin molybdenumtransferase MoeA [Rhodoferax sp.]|jgi:molybdopterin molybdotransferase|uniref:molybdopterin molybdotransferase MoeA n=1 Tax=Rhodoferax sp. TaxID=50421 RepID=UPI001B7473AF|nr:gephyrin-like molybdotransferase Glp [Rhodoferax sp.]MBP8286215.1 molybdopterin molybdenumtransferase MoeA [Rhodoferax sp.]MBP9149758.1 molybdopterin molybdenumtransferase MoeA [Rhodoferax sp.]MBP9736822.1 molybdopterin molybdenumtransferase MoeA [Rhodoferax sp.]
MKTLEQIAAELQGYDPQALDADTVNRFLAALGEPLTETEEVETFQALGRVLAQDLVSPISVPPHDNSAMDGYAFDGAQLDSGHALTLQIVGTALAGAAWQGTVTAGQCVRIMTGAIMPAGLDTVVPQEFVTVSPPLPGTRVASITLPAGVVHAGDNRRQLGEDLLQGRPALSKGERITPAALGLVASLGIQSVAVLRHLRVAYFSTGDEILSLGEAPREGAVYDSNRCTVFGLLTRLGCQVIDLGVVSDDPARLEAALTRAALQADVIITSGGVSVGEADYTKSVMKKLGDVAFWKIAMRPGRPMAVGQIFRNKLALSAYPESDDSSFSSSKLDSSAVLFGLPGNPVAVMVTFLAFVRPALLRLMGCTRADAPMLQAQSTEPIRKKKGRTEYQRGIVSTCATGHLQVRTTGNQGSGVLSSMVQANGLILLHHDQASVAIGDMVSVMMFDGFV